MTDRELPREWSGELTVETQERIAGIIEAVLSHWCAMTSVILFVPVHAGSRPSIEVRGGVRGVRKDGRIAHLFPAGEHAGVGIWWATDDYHYSIHEDAGNPARVSWWRGRLEVTLDAPAGNHLWWIWTPIRSITEASND